MFDPSSGSPRQAPHESIRSPQGGEHVGPTHRTMRMICVHRFTGNQQKNTNTHKQQQKSCVFCVLCVFLQTTKNGVLYFWIFGFWIF